MTTKIQNHKKVKNDLLNAKNWYRNQQNGLDKRFSLEIRKTLNYIIKNPLQFQIKYNKTRTAFTEIFPYGVHYHFNAETGTITILGIFHTSVNPEKWSERMF